MLTCGGERRLCRGHSVLSQVAAKCDGKQNCAVKVDSLWLGDSCFGVSKYLTTAYQCVRQDQLLQLERERSQLTFAPTQTDQPTQQPSTKKPTTPQPTTKQPTTKQPTQATKRPTTIVVPTRSPIVPADPEYNKTFTVCEYTQLEATCPRGLAITMRQAEYKRTDDYTCSHGVADASRCPHTNAFAFFAERCDGRVHCHVTLIPDRMQELARGAGGRGVCASRYLVGSYDCLVG
jgi:hypothetical protein